MPFCVLDKHHESARGHIGGTDPYAGQSMLFMVDYAWGFRDALIER